MPTAVSLWLSFQLFQPFVTLTCFQQALWLPVAYHRVEVGITTFTRWNFHPNSKAY